MIDNCSYTHKLSSFEINSNLNSQRDHFAVFMSSNHRLGVHFLFQTLLCLTAMIRHVLISFCAGPICDLSSIPLQNIFSPYLPDAWSKCGATRFRTWQIQIERNIPARRKETS